MTEAAWLRGAYIEQLLEYVLRRADARRVALFGCACCRCAQDWSLPPLERKAIEANERYRDGEIARRTWLRAELALIAESRKPSRPLTPWELDFRNAVLQLFHDTTGFSVVHALTRAVHAVSTPEYAATFEAKLCFVIRDIFGNPFRTVPFAPEWRTDTVRAMARAMYESREFGAMPILADALQEAGCDSAPILDHCRDPNEIHVRGCWVVDRVLEKA
jgi:hypothetical protein